MGEGGKLIWKWIKERKKAMDVEKGLRKIFGCLYQENGYQFHSRSSCRADSEHDYWFHLIFVWFFYWLGMYVCYFEPVISWNNINI